MRPQGVCAGALLAARLAATLVAAGCSGGGGADPGRAAAAGPADWREDPRLVALLAPCAPLGHFDGDTSDLTAVLVEKLSTGELSVTRHVREELARGGEEVIEELERAVRRSYTSGGDIPRLRNAVGVLGMLDDARARPILARCLEHPHEDVRAKAARGLVKHATAADYDALASLLAISGPGVRATLTQAMQTADPERLLRDFVRWVAAEQNQDLWPHVARILAGTAGPQAIEGISSLAADVQRVEVRPFLVAALARAGAAGALDDLRELLRSEEPQRRTWALEACELAGSPLEAVPILRDDPSDVLRAMAAGLLDGAADVAAARAALRAGLDDPADDVRRACLTVLLRHGDPAAADLALAMLTRGRREMQIALLALREGWDANPDLAARAFDVLARLQSECAAQPLDERQSIVQALGTLPLRAGAEFLLELARAEGGAIHKMSAHRWIVRQAGNTAPGRAVLSEAWWSEEDSHRRLDLLEGAVFGDDDPTRDFLIAVVQAERTSPWELLFAADRLARLGPAHTVAPLLKRVALRVEQGDVRRAMNCLLWRWYGRPQ